MPCTERKHRAPIAERHAADAMTPLRICIRAAPDPHCRVRPCLALRTSSGLGDAFLLETLKSFRMIEHHPTAWHPLSENTRRCRLSRFPYAVLAAIISPHQSSP